MWDFLIEFSLFGFYPFRGIWINLIDGTFFTWIFISIVSIFIYACILNTGIIQFTLKVCRYLIINFLKLIIKIIEMCYLFLLLVLKGKCSPLQYLGKIVVHKTGVTYTHNMGEDDITISHPKTINYIIVLYNNVIEIYHKTLTKYKSLS